MLPQPLYAYLCAARNSNDLTADPAVEAVNLAAIELTAALVLLLLNKFLLPPLKLREYYDLTDNSYGIYTAASLFCWIEPMTETVEGVWKEVFYKSAQEAKQKVPETNGFRATKKRVLHL